MRTHSPSSRLYSYKLQVSKFLAGIILSTLSSIPVPALAQNKTVPIPMGASISERLEPGDAQLTEDGSYFDAYTFTGTAGQQVVITMSSEDLDSYLILLDAQGNRLIQDDDGAGNLDARIVYTLPNDGQYIIYANAYNSGHGGSYSLELETITVVSPVRATTSTTYRRYFCNEMGQYPVTQARRKDGVTSALIAWTNDLALGGMSAVQRCREVANHLEAIHDRLGRNFTITVGRLRNQPVVCAATASGACDAYGQILTATSDGDAQNLALQLGTALTELRNFPAGAATALRSRPDDTTPLTITPVFAFRDALAYSYCLEDVLQLYQNPQQFNQLGRRSDCLTDIFTNYADGISRSQALEIITAADKYATQNFRPSILYPPRGQRVRIEELFDFTYAVDQQ